jgi:hypothetical protein
MAIAGWQPFSPQRERPDGLDEVKTSLRCPRIHSNELAPELLARAESDQQLEREAAGHTADGVTKGLGDEALLG